MENFNNDEEAVDSFKLEEQRRNLKNAVIAGDSTNVEVSPIIKKSVESVHSPITDKGAKSFIPDEEEPINISNHNTISSSEVTTSSNDVTNIKNNILNVNINPTKYNISLHFKTSTINNEIPAESNLTISLKVYALTIDTESISFFLKDDVMVNLPMLTQFEISVNNRTYPVSYVGVNIKIQDLTLIGLFRHTNIDSNENP